jgi:hypothetical protein
MPINPTTLKALIDTQITNETVDFAITPTEVGSRMKDTIDYTTEQIATVTATPDATTSVKGKIQLAGDLSGTANLPTVPALTNKENLSNKSTDVAVDGLSDTKYPSVKAVKDYADGLVVGLLDDRGNYNASSNVFPSTGGSGISGAILTGDLWFISVAGTLGGVSVPVGASIRALVNSPAQTSTNWSILNVGLGFTPENVVNKSTDVNTDGGSDTKYPSVKAVKTYVDANSVVPITNVLKTTIIQAEILNLFSTPIIILPASVDLGIYRQIVNVIVKRSGAGTAYNVAAQLVVSLGNSSAYPIQQLSNFVLSDTTWSSFAVPDTNYIFKNDLVTFPNVYKIQALSSNPTGGTGNIDVYVTYIEIAL